MKIFVLSPNINTLFTEEQLHTLEQAGELLTVSEPQPFEHIEALFSGSDPRIVAMDPDFSEWQLPNGIIDKIPNLKAICLQTTGFNWVDVDHAKEKGVVVTQLKGFSSIAVAEWATFMALAVARRLPIVIEDNWKLDYDKHRGVELRGKTAGVVGIGRIGTAIAENMAGLGMNVQYWSRQSRNDTFTYVELNDLVSTSDVLFIAIATNAETKSLISNQMMDTIKPTAFIVSVVDPIFDQSRLIELAEAGRLGGYAYEDEKGPFGKHTGNIWNGPSLGWCTNESMAKNSEQWVESIVQAVKGEYPGRVN